MWSSCFFFFRNAKEKISGLGMERDPGEDPPESRSGFSGYMEIDDDSMLALLEAVSSPESVEYTTTPGRRTQPPEPSISEPARAQQPVPSQRRVPAQRTPTPAQTSLAQPMGAPQSQRALATSTPVRRPPTTRTPVKKPRTAPTPVQPSRPVPALDPPPVRPDPPRLGSAPPFGPTLSTPQPQDVVRPPLGLGEDLRQGSVTRMPTSGQTVSVLGLGSGLGTGSYPGTLTPEERKSISARQAELLSQPIPAEEIKSRAGSGGKRFSYITGADAIQTMNIIFGYGGWTSEIREITSFPPIKVPTAQGRSAWKATARCVVRVTTLLDGAYHDGVGMDNKTDPSLETAMENSVKGAETDAIKRAILKFGPRVGLSLYKK